jgi:hypothetical protein
MRNLFTGLARGRSATAVPEPAAPIAREPELIELLVMTADETFTVKVPAPPARITDWLNSEELIRGRRADEEAWTDLARSEWLVVVPPDAAGDPKRRLHRPKQRVVVRLGPITVTGAASAPAGTEVTAFLGRHGQAFVALTAVTIESATEPPRSVPVAIVHLALANAFAPVSGSS